MSRLVARLAAVIAPVALLLPTAVHAAQVTVDDAVNDAKALNLADGFLISSVDSGEAPFLPAPDEVATDVTRTTIKHGRRVSVTTHFRDLVETAEHFVDMRIFTPDGRFSLSAGRSTDGGQLTNGTGYAILSPTAVGVDDDHPRPCRTVRGRYDLEAETMTVSFPAACIGKPRWIQVGSVATRLQVTPLGDGSVNLAGWADDAFRSSLSENSWARSPRVRRG